jgi:hypothetical protein
VICVCHSRFERVCSATFTNLPIRHPPDSPTYGYLSAAYRTFVTYLDYIALILVLARHWPGTYKASPSQQLRAEPLHRP